MDIDIDKIIKIHWYRGCIYRLKRLPLILYKIRRFLKSQNIVLSESNDGRMNSAIDENKVVSLLQEEFGDRIKKTSNRMWYDILVFDYLYGWLPVNIKITTTLTNDNSGNLAMCVYSYTNYHLDIHKTKAYNNGAMGKILCSKLSDRYYNTSNKRDYYFIVINKNKSNSIIINSIKGLTSLTPNLNNLLFQIKWSVNRKFRYQRIDRKIQQFIDCMKTPKPNWKEEFISDMRALTI